MESEIFRYAAICPFLKVQQVRGNHGKNALKYVVTANR